MSQLKSQWMEKESTCLSFQQENDSLRRHLAELEWAQMNFTSFHRDEDEEATAATTATPTRLECLQCKVI